MDVRNLSDTSFQELLTCFLLVFENYYVPMPTDSEYYKNRWKASKVDFRFSYGMFDSDRLIGFIIHAVDKRNGELVAFNTGTGVILEYRGRGVTRLIYEYALKDLKENGFDKSRLEVIVENEKALALYQKIGFDVCKNYKCYNGDFLVDDCGAIEVKERDIKGIEWSTLPNQPFYSWDNQKESIVEGDYQFFEVIYEAKPESYFIINSSINYVAQFDLLDEKNEGWKRLFCAIKQVSESVKINNVDARLTAKVNFLKEAGLKNVIDQYEMELLL